MYTRLYCFFSLSHQVQLVPLDPMDPLDPTDPLDPLDPLPPDQTMVTTHPAVEQPHPLPTTTTHPSLLLPLPIPEHSILPMPLVGRSLVVLHPLTRVTSTPHLPHTSPQDLWILKTNLRYTGTHPDCYSTACFF